MDTEGLKMLRIFLFFTGNEEKNPHFGYIVFKTPKNNLKSVFTPFLSSLYLLKFISIVKMETFECLKAETAFR